MRHRRLMPGSVLQNLSTRAAESNRLVTSGCDGVRAQYIFQDKQQ